MNKDERLKLIRLAVEGEMYYREDDVFASHAHLDKEPDAADVAEAAVRRAMTPPTAPGGQS